VAAVILAEAVTHVQLHDYHGGMCLQYLPENVQPEVLYVAHNAHYNAQFPVPTKDRRLKVRLDAGSSGRLLERGSAQITDVLGTSLLAE
jgi:hypothetical protein